MPISASARSRAPSVRAHKSSLSGHSRNLASSPRVLFVSRRCSRTVLLPPHAIERAECLSTDDRSPPGSRRQHLHPAAGQCNRRLSPRTVHVQTTAGPGASVLSAVLNRSIGSRRDTDKATFQTDSEAYPTDRDGHAVRRTVKRSGYKRRPPFTALIGRRSRIWREKRLSVRTSLVPGFPRDNRAASRAFLRGRCSGTGKLAHRRFPSSGTTRRGRSQSMLRTYAPSLSDDSRELFSMESVQRMQQEPNKLMADIPLKSGEPPFRKVRCCEKQPGTTAGALSGVINQACLVSGPTKTTSLISYEHAGVITRAGARRKSGTRSPWRSHVHFR